MADDKTFTTPARIGDYAPVEWIDLGLLAQGLADILEPGSDAIAEVERFQYIQPSANRIHRNGYLLGERAEIRQLIRLPDQQTRKANHLVDILDAGKVSQVFTEQLLQAKVAPATVKTVIGTQEGFRKAAEAHQ